jgi:uncharacterized alkaline shock family protein YloU
MPIKNESLGLIEISPAAVSTIASQAINQCYGVVGMASKNLVNGISSLLSKEHRRGIEVEFEDEQLVIDVYVIVEHGVRIRAVAESIQNTVKFHVEKGMGIPVEAVNVYIQGLRIKKERTRES